MTLWAFLLLEVPTHVRELQGIRVVQQEGQTSLSREYCCRLPTAGTSPSLSSLPALIRMAGGNERPGSPNIGKVLECHGYENDWNLSGMAIPRFQGRNPSYTSSPRGGKDRKSRVAGYERLPIWYGNTALPESESSKKAIKSCRTQIFTKFHNTPF